MRPARARTAALGALVVLLLVCHAASADDAPALSGDDILTKGEKRYSQFDEELIIRHFFQDRRAGFFVDVGAAEWQRSSTTLYLEKHLGWSGIAIDAQPWLEAGYVKNRPSTKFFNYIVTDHSGTKDSFYAAGGLSSTTKDHVLLYKGGDKLAPKEIKIPTITLNQLLDDNGVTAIDFLSMDIEQGEPAALAGFDIQRFKPALVGIEAGKPVRERIATYFAANGYERIDKYLEYDKVNWWFKPAARAPDDDR